MVGQTKKCLGGVIMEENKNDVSTKEMRLLIQEIGKGLYSLRSDRSGLRKELEKYNDRSYVEGDEEVKQLEEDLSRVTDEISLKEQEIKSVQEVALAKQNIDKRLSEVNELQSKIVNDYEKTKKQLLIQKQEEKAALISEAEASLANLRKTRDQLNSELENYRAKNFEQGISELEGDLGKILPEIEAKEQRLSNLQSGTFYQEGIDDRLSQLEDDYKNSLKDNKDIKQSPLKEKQAQNDIADGLMNKYNIRERYKDELSEERADSLEASSMPDWMEELDKDDLQGSKESNSPKTTEEVMEEQRRMLESNLPGWMKDEEIDRQNYEQQKPEETTVPVQEEVAEPEPQEEETVTQTPIIVPEARGQELEEQREPEHTEPAVVEETEQEIVQEEQINNEVPANMRNRLNSVRLTYKSGRPEYEISYNDGNGKLQIETISDIEPRAMTDKEKQVYKQSIEPKHKRDLLGVDVGIIVALHEVDERNGGKSQLGYQYLYYLRDLISNDKERGENDIDIIYDLSDIKDAKLSLRDRLTISRIAAKSERLGTAEYIPAPNKIRDFFRSFRQKKLPSGREQTLEEFGHDAVDDLANEKGFDMDTFLEQQESVQGEKLTQEEKDRFMDTYYDAKERNAWREELKVDTEPLPQQEQTQNDEAQEREEEAR